MAEDAFLARGSRELRARAVELRRSATTAEARLWHHLRGRQLGVKVRRQHPIGPFIADFCIHATQVERDAARTALLEAAGYRVIRFTNAQVLDQIDAVLTQLRALLAE